MEYKKQTNYVYKCDYHIVISTKYRKKIINEGVFGFIKLKLEEMRKYHPDIEYKEVNHEKDHIHVLVSIPPKMSVGQVVGKMKSKQQER